MSLVAPTQNVPLTTRSSVPRTLRNNSSTAELMAEYSPPIPQPVKNRKMAKLRKFQEMHWRWWRVDR